MEFNRIQTILYLKRWNGLITNQQESVMEHSFVVTVFSRLIAESLFEDNTKILKVVTRALFHDFDEAFSGDIPHQIKHDNEVGIQMRNAIDIYTKRELLRAFPKDTEFGKTIQDGSFLGEEYVHKIVKLADWLSMLLFLEREVKLGNKEMEKHMNYCKKNTEDSIETLKELLTWQVEHYKVNVLDEILKTIL